MIQSKDLRIGNLIHYFSDGVNSVIQVNVGVIGWAEDDPKGFNLCHSFISLTEELLLKFGFIKSISKGINFSGKEVITISYSYADYTIGIESDKFIFCVQDCLCISELKYVHQLQNLYFALTGTELIIQK